MLFFLLAVCAYALYSLFMAENGISLAGGAVRLALVMMAISSGRFKGGMLLSGALLLFATVVLGAMVVMRKEVQLKNDQR